MAKEAIFGYELLEVLGEGPRGTVYKARDLKTQSVVALKLFHTLETEKPERLLRLKHPHLSIPRDFGRMNSQSFVVTEYLAGGTLKDHLRAMRAVGDVFPYEQILKYAEEMADALMYAHGLGIPHGSIKSENVMFGEDGTLRLTDFDVRASTNPQAGKNGDLEAFGKVLYELATGQLPFPGVTVPPVDAVRKDVPMPFAQIVSRIVDRERQDRYDDFRSVIRDLKAASAPEAVTRMIATLPGGSPSVPEGPALSEGRLMAGRFKIVRFIARGGMGDVYEAEDLELRERVALKTIRPEIARAPQAIERFRREIQLARKVTDPNVCRIFDIFHDTAGPENITFLTMELLNGETLHQRLERTGRMTETEAFPIIRQMAAGLAAAHRAGVIHRDFKSSNVMLVADEAALENYRAVVTDFGLARPALAQEAMATLSQPGDALGTPAYMAPEQLENGEITPASDVYAFGVVLYEMLTGTLPFIGESSLAAVLKRLQGPPPSPRTHVPELDTVWEATILRCLERNPINRFGNIEDAVKALTGETVLAPLTAPGAGSWGTALRRHRVEVAMAAALFMLAGVLAGALVIRNKAFPGGIKSRPSIAVMGFKNLNGRPDAAWLSTALAEMLTTELAAGEKLRAIPEENVARMSSELSLPESSSFSPETLARIRDYLGADVVVDGSYVVTGNPDKLRIDLRLHDSVEGKLVTTISQEGDAADLLTLVSRSGAALREKLGVDKLEPKEAEVAQAALPSNPEAARAYTDGLEKLRVFDALGAQAALEKAIAADGNYALAHAALATAWSMQGYATKAREQSKIALDLSTKLGREDRLVVEGRAREAAREWRQASEVYSRLFGYFADNLDYGLRLAEAQISAGDPKHALETIASLRKFPAPDRDSPRIDLAEARAAGALSDFKREQEMAAVATKKGKQHGAKLLATGARLLEGMAFTNLGDLKQAQAAFEEARTTYAAAGGRWDAANASTNLASVVLRSGDVTQAEKTYQESLATYRELGDRKGEAAVLTSLGTILRNRGDFSGAKKIYEQDLAIRREIDDRIGEATSRNNLANVLGLMGDAQNARETYQAALVVFREIGDRNGAATVLSNLGDLVFEEGDLARARELYEESRATFQELGIKSSLAYELSRLGDLDLINGDFASARKHHQEALAIRREMGDKAGVGESQLHLAQISLHQGDAASAEAAAKSAAEAFAAVNRPDDEASAMAVLARSLLAGGKNAESAQAIQRAEELSMKSSDRSIRLSVAITGASIRATRGEAAKAQKDLEGIIREARNAKLIELQLEAGLALAEIEIASGRFQAGRQRLDALEMEASQKGYKYIADRAAAARKKIPGLTA